MSVGGTRAQIAASLAFGPSPEVGVILQAMALGGAVGALAASRSFRRTGTRIGGG